MVEQSELGRAGGLLGNLPIIAAIGNFDGVHRGHQYLLAQTADFAKSHHAALGVVLFEPHPRRFFQPDAPAFLISSPSQRDGWLAECGVEKIYKLAFDGELSGLSAEEFILDVLIGKLALKGVAVGAEFQFGKNRGGNTALLTDLGEANGLRVRIIDPIDASNQVAPSQIEKIGSSAIRRSLRDGDVRAAASMLGRAWQVVGTIIEGQRLARSMGFPTANIQLDDQIEPLHGVYAIRAAVGGDVYDGIANFGRKPTVGDHAPLLEVHLFDFTGDLYNKTVSVDFIDFIREERRFDGLDALKAQISEDCDQARSLLKMRGG